MDDVILDIAPEEIDSFLDDILDFTKFAPNYLKIKDEDGNIVPFVLNELQLYVLEKGDVLGKLSRGEKVRLDILKCRQTGITTLFQGLYIWLSLIEENQKFLMLGHEDESSTNMFDMFERYYDNLPSPLQPPLDTKQQGKRLKYESSDNLLIVKTAGAGISRQKAGTGRSSTFQYIHATECAFYPDYKTTMAGLAQASKKAKLIVRETTANGFNSYHNVWLTSKAGKSDYVPIFLAWIDFKSYSLPFKSRFDETKLINSLGSDKGFNSFVGEENLLMDSYNCTLEQLNWRRWAIINLCESDIDIFHQEYPTTDDEAFISSGRPVFHSGKCHKNYANSKDGIRGDILDSGEFVENPKGFVTLHHDIEYSDREHYIFAGGVDVAEGLEQGDYSVVKVLDRRLDKVVLTWHGHLDPDLFAHELKKIQTFLGNKVVFEIEKNNHGLHVVIKAFELGVNIKYSQDFTKGYEVSSHQGLGFTTNMKTKPIIIDQLSEWIRDDLFTDFEKEFWSECLTFVRDDRGRMGAQNKLSDPSTKTYDDRVIAEALMINCSLWLPSYFVEKPKEQVRIPEELQIPEYDESIL